MICVDLFCTDQVRATSQCKIGGLCVENELAQNSADNLTEQ